MYSIFGNKAVSLIMFGMVNALVIEIMRLCRVWRRVLCLFVLDVRSVSESRF